MPMARPTHMLMAPMLTRTADQQSCTTIGVARSIDGGRAVVSLAASGPVDRPVISPMLLSSDEAGARVSLVPQGALLLAGDAISITVEVGPGAHLELVEPAGTVAYPMEGASASWNVEIRLAPMATLVWDTEPFVLAAGSCVQRQTSISVAWDARFAIRETMVFGRSDEPSGDVTQRFEVIGPNAQPMMIESLYCGPESSMLLLGGARTVGSIIVGGYRLPEVAGRAEHPKTEGTRFELEAEATLIRSMAIDTHQARMPGSWAAALQSIRGAVAR